ncbi:MAG: CPBP family intramembrane glutamic endopeptidase [Candidatus Acidiferrales bacterium]
MAEEYSAAESLSQPAASPAPQPSVVHNIFVGPNGIRAGWRLLIFLLVFMALTRGANFVLHRIPAVERFAASQPKDVFTPAGMLANEGLLVLLLCCSVGIMALIERRPIREYGMPVSEFLGKRFWQGVPLGFIMLSLLLVMIAALHGFSLDGIGVGSTEALKYGALYFIGFILVGVFEEFSFRGYMQFTLGSGIGFWPAAILLSIAFGAIHLNNSGEAIFGAIMAGSFGLVAAFALYRTGNLWLPIGMHASWDWGETYFYGTPDSGLLAQGHFLNSSFHGANWLTGGTVGPEGSWLVFAVLIIWAIAIHFLFPAKAQSAH